MSRSADSTGQIADISCAQLSHISDGLFWVRFSKSILLAQRLVPAPCNEWMMYPIQLISPGAREPPGFGILQIPPGTCRHPWGTESRQAAGGTLNASTLTTGTHTRVHSVGTSMPAWNRAPFRISHLQAHQQPTSMDLFTHLHSCDIPRCAPSEQQLATNINERDTMMTELHYLVWKFLLLLRCPYRRWAPGRWRTCEHTSISVTAQESSALFSVSTAPIPSSPAHLWGPDGLCSVRDLVLFAPRAKSLWAPQPCCLPEVTDSSAPLYLSRSSMCSFFFSPLCPFSPVQFRLNFITAFLPSVSVHPHPSTLTLNGKVSLSVGNADNRLFHN